MNKKIKILLLTLCTLSLAALYLAYDAQSDVIIKNVRLPRLLLCLLCGVSLSAVGMVYQAMLKNPLADPFILGISSGSAFFSTIALILGFYSLMPAFGFAGALITMLAVWKLSGLNNSRSSSTILLSGIICGMFFSALISLTMFLNQQDIGNIISVLMGSTAKIFTKNQFTSFLIASGASVLLLFQLIKISGSFDVIATGDLSASSLGVDVKKVQKQVFVIASILTGICVSYAGIIGFVGLIVPHLTRLAFGASVKKNLPIAMFMGAFILILCDFIAMHIGSFDLPVGIITSFIGAPFFIVVMIKNRS